VTAVALLAAAATATAMAEPTAAAAAAANPKPSRMVLRVDDLPAGFEVAKQYVADLGRAAKENGRAARTLRGWGYLVGYQREFLEPASARRVVASASVYATVAGAHASVLDSVAATRTTLAGLPFRPVSLGGSVGADFHAYRVAGPYQGAKIELYVTVWRHGRVKSVVEIGGPAGSTSAGEALRLVRAQERRIAAEAR
jgi:hypothetical protein